MQSHLKAEKHFDSSEVLRVLSLACEFFGPDGGRVQDCIGDAPTRLFKIDGTRLSFESRDFLADAGFDVMA
jgi:hypothetical protein